MKEYEEPKMEVLDIEMIMAYDVMSDDEETGFGPLIG